MNDQLLGPASLVRRFAYAVLGLGLANCAPKSEDSRPRSAWRVSPEVRSDKDGKAIAKIRGNGDDRVRDASDWIDFVVGDGETPPSQIDVNARCQSGKTLATAQRQFVNARSIQIRALLPLPALAAPQAPERELTCAFAFVVRNREGSTHRFEATNVRIAAPVQEAGLVLSRRDRRLDPVNWRENIVESKELADLNIESPTEPEGPAELTLACEKFTVRAATSGRPAIEGLLRSQAFANDGSPYLALASREAAAAEPLLEQACRIALVTGNSARASAYFRLRLGSPGTRFVARAAMETDFSTRASTNDVKLFKMTVTNGDPIDRWALLPKGSAAGMRLRPVMSGLGLSGHARSGPFCADRPTGAAMPRQPWRRILPRFTSFPPASRSR
jgi:hypothetical protein